MGKRQAKKKVEWSRLVIGAMVSLLMYLLGIFLLTLLMVKGVVVPEKKDLILAMWAMVSAACGSLPVLKINVVTPLFAGLMQGFVFAVLILVVSYLLWEGPEWSKANIALLMCALVGGILPGVPGHGGGRRKRKRAW